MGGGGTITWNITHRRVPCRFETQDKNEVGYIYNKKTVYPDYWVYLEYRSDIKEGDMIYLGDREFEIVLTQNWSEQDRYIRMAVVEMKRAE